MTHERASLLLTEYVLGHLDDEEAAPVRTHVRGCDACQALVAFVEALREALHDDDALVEHPDAMDLARLVTDDASFSFDDRARIGAHVKTCAVCHDALETARTAMAEPHAASWWKAVQKRLRGTGRAVAGLIVGAGVTGTLWATQPPRGAPDVALTAPVVTLDRATRALDEAPALVLDATATHAVVEIPIDPWNARASGDDFEIAIRVMATDHDWTRTTNASAVFDVETARVRLLLPRDAFAPGAGTLRLIATDDDTILYRGVFTVRPATP